MTGIFSAFGWALAVMAAGAVVVLRARLERVARAEHELRGPATVLCMACERLRQDPAAQGHAEALEAELARLRAGLADLTAARAGKPRRLAPAPLELERIARSAVAGWQPALESRGREVRIDWRAGRPRLVADRGRLAQALGNLVANAAEHGEGPVELRSDRTERGVRLEVRNGRPSPEAGAERASAALRGGRGLGIAARAARSAGARLELVPERKQVAAVLELPLADANPPVDAPDPTPDAA